MAPRASASKLATADLFAGVGGISLALAPISVRRLACEIDPWCRSVLRKDMVRRGAKKFEVHEDVVRLTGADLTRAGVDCIIAGFPCQDVSCANCRPKGLDGARSGLFFQILRLVDECPRVHVVFLENSDRMMLQGDRVAAEFVRRGFSVAMGVFTACGVGAPHRRRRWFCLAVRRGRPLPPCPPPIRYAPWYRKKEPCTRTILRPEDVATRTEVKRRLQSLGNSVVPSQVARLDRRRRRGAGAEGGGRASSSTASADAELRKAGWEPLEDRTPTRTEPEADRLARVYDGSVGDGWREVAIRLRGEPSPPLGLVMTWPSGHTERARWMTPTVEDCCRFTARPVHRHKGILSQQIYHERSTFVKKPHEMGQSPYSVMLNPRFLEYMMGFPTDWTRPSAASLRS
jgi:DNA (cytosine-5)-methyltransferase 1